MNGPRHKNSCLIAYANSDGSGEAWDLSASLVVLHHRCFSIDFVNLLNLNLKMRMSNR